MKNWKINFVFPEVVPQSRNPETEFNLFFFLNCSRNSLGFVLFLLKNFFFPLFFGANGITHRFIYFFLVESWKEVMKEKKKKRKQTTKQKNEQKTTTSNRCFVCVFCVWTYKLNSYQRTEVAKQILLLASVFSRFRSSELCSCVFSLLNGWKPVIVCTCIEPTMRTSTSTNSTVQNSACVLIVYTLNSRRFGLQCTLPEYIPETPCAFVLAKLLPFSFVWTCC